jgi:hypothetical protein
MSNDMVTLLCHKHVTPQLRDWLSSTTDKLNSGRETFLRRREEAKKLGKVELNAEKWLQSKFKHLGILELTDEEVSHAKAALSAAFEYEAWLTRQTRNHGFSLSKEKSSWVDTQQLLYLSDPAMHILCHDNDFLQRSGGSPQKARILMLPDVVLEAHQLATSTLATQVG